MMQANQAPTQTQSQNLLNTVSAEKVTRPPGSLFGLIVDSISVLFAMGTGFTLTRFISGSLSIWWMLIFGLFLVVSSLVQMLLTRKTSRRALVIFLQALGISAFFYSFGVSLMLWMMAIIFVFFFWGDLLSRHEYKTGLTIRFFKISKPLLNKMITAIVLVGVIGSLPGWANSDVIFPKTSFSGIFQTGIGLISKFYPELKFDSTIESFTKSVATLSLKGNPAFTQLSPELRDQAAAKAAEEIAKQMSDTLGFSVSGKETMEDVFYTYFQKLLNSLKKNFGGQFLFVWAFGVFLIFRSFGFFFYVVAAPLSYFIYQLLVALGIISIVGENKMHEVLEYSVA